MEETIALSHVIFKDVYEPVIKAEKHVNPLGLQMGIDVQNVIGTYATPGLTGEVVLTFWSGVFGIKMPYLRRLSFRETICYYALVIGHMFLDGTWIRSWHTKRVRERLEFMKENREELMARWHQHDDTKRYSAEQVAATPCGFYLAPDFVKQMTRVSGDEESVDDFIILDDEKNDENDNAIQRTVG